jgi:hypothetical protein
MVALRILFNILSIIGAALAGNWLGGNIRSILTREPVSSICFQYITPGGRKISNIPVLTKFYPALLFASFGKPRYLYAFLGGMATGILINDNYERLLWQQFEKLLPTNHTN